ncbi:DUF4163 domain-containing protein [Ectobacillus ponti]|uniref:DUF4163 domain-containing protein n=1 Tax=Ectobacillus ponti TaxID=2961894 RepID=A0AA41X705_9BACI|nr:DUF4163 domain-containing protein [Ectobacillus ponti]MCP8967774.1 DUF4163 domain-containing protein [Ectobacillus ponti]
MLKALCLALLVAAPAAYQASPATYQHLNVTIHYPQVTGLEDYQKQLHINSTLQQDALQLEGYYEPVDQSLALDANYEVKRKDHLLSVVYTGLGYVKGAAHPNHLLLTTNVDMNNGVRLRLPDIVRLDEGFVKLLKQKAKGPDGILQEMPDAELLQRLQMADVPESRDCSTFSYFTKTSLIISFGVAHVLGDHAEFGISYKDIALYVKNRSQL